MLKIKKLFISFVKWAGLCLLTGVFGGAVGTLFSRCISFATDIRTQNGWLICLLPVAAWLVTGIYRWLKISGMGTDQLINSVRGENQLSVKLAPAVFVCSVISHLFGASVGREGAALQLGGGMSTLAARIFRLNENERRILLHCGMAALFSAVFGTPLAAFAFALEVVYVGHICLKAVLPTLLSSFVAYFTAVISGAHPERFSLSFAAVSFADVWKVIVIALLGAVVSMLFCLALKYSKRLFRCLFKNEFLRISVGGLIIVLLTLVVGNQDYNGAGIDVINRIFSGGSVGAEAFLLKILFTCVAVAAGFKGGEIIPTLFIGAALGCTAAIMLGFTAEMGAAIGMTALFCGVTNCPLAAIFLSAELFSGKGLPYIILAAIISFAASGGISVYSAQKVKGFKRIF